MSKKESNKMPKTEEIRYLGKQLTATEEKDTTRLRTIVTRLIELTMDHGERMAENGDRVKDIITGLTGIMTGCCDYLTGCTQGLIKPEMLKDGKMIDGYWIDIQRIEIIDRGAIDLDNSKTPGGPQESPPSR